MTETPAQIVERQACDDALWFEAATAAEAYLQRALRELHAAVEEHGVGAKKGIWPKPEPLGGVSDD